MLVVGLWVVFRFTLFFFPEEEKQARSELGQAIRQNFPEQAAQMAETFGLRRFKQRSSNSMKSLSGSPVVVLIHGLDDPGKTWMNLAPALHTQGIDVWIMNYPNDQAITDSARLFRDELIKLRANDVHDLSIVSHSMGGLVTREMLTNPDIAYQTKIGPNRVPRVTRFVMVGTPNHGSELARFRFLGELRDQWANTVVRDRPLLSGFLDGAGEAGIDLRPGSVFLDTLNRRDLPPGVEMLIIAGVISPWDDEAVRPFLDSTLSPEIATETELFMQSMSNGLGDGLVTVESTRLEGIEQVTVPGTHLSMIRNILSDSDRIPPSVPIIVQFMQEK